MGSAFGRIFKVTTFGESHGKGIGVIVDGCPAGLTITEEAIQQELNRRKPGQSEITTPRNEADQIRILSGVFENTTLGTPIGLVIQNKDAKPSAYDNLKDLYRPGHADFTYDARYGIRDWRGGGRASARETASRVAAGAIAKHLLKELVGLETLAWVDQVREIRAQIDMDSLTAEKIEANAVRCPDPVAAETMISAISAAKQNGNSLGGKIGFCVNRCPAGLGEPVFDKLTADIAKACMSIPASRAISFGLGEQAIHLTGIEHNDPFTVKDNNRIGTESNHAGGILGGISNGERIYGTVVFKPTATIMHDQKTVTRQKEPVTFKASGRHDPCVLPRAVPVVEAMINLVLTDHLLHFATANLENLKKIFF